jgi:hypothetical protein
VAAILGPLCHADSVAAITVISTDPTDLDTRWRFTLAGLDRLLGDAGLDLPERHDAVRRWRDALSDGLGATGLLARRRAGHVFRRERDRLDLTGGRFAGVLDQRTAFVRPLFVRSVAGAHRGDVVRTLASRHVNRMLRAAHAVQELVLYDLLDRSYSARVKRAE